MSSIPETTENRRIATTAEFKKGDIVRLKSGGPEMTVIAVEDDDISCTWFDGKKPPHEKGFPRDALHRVTQTPQVDLSGLSKEERQTLAQLLRRALPPPPPDDGTGPGPASRQPRTPTKSE